MNLELLKEIKELRAKKMSDTDVSSFLGISKANMLLMIRIESVVSDFYLDEIDILKSTNLKLEKINSSQNLDLEERNHFIEKMKLEDINKLKNDLDIKSKDLKLLISKFDNLETKYSLLDYKYNSIPRFVRKYLISE